LNEMELVRQLQTGSRTAFDQIYERYHVQAYRTAVLLTGNRADAEDVVQETFVQVYLHAKELKEPAGFKSWFYRILTRLAWKCGRNGKREIPDEDIAVRADRADGGDCLSRLIGKEERERVRKAVESLDEKKLERNHQYCGFGRIISGGIPGTSCRTWLESSVVHGSGSRFLSGISAGAASG